MTFASIRVVLRGIGSNTIKMDIVEVFKQRYQGGEITAAVKPSPTASLEREREVVHPGGREASQPADQVVIG